MSKRKEAPASSPSYSRGAIVRIRLHNFMSYRDAEIADVGTKLNCIIGPNGTGKSSIVCAMCVGLGGSLGVTERGDKIKECVHGSGGAKDERGQPIRSGWVETELYDEPANAVVRVEFDVDNKQAWTLDGKASTQKAVRARMKELNIQVDNPLQFLPQDKVGQFSNMSPVELLKHTEMAIGPEVYAQHQALIAEDAKLAEAKRALATEEKTLDDLVKQNAALERDVERWESYQRNVARLRQMEGKKLWLAYEEEKTKAEAASAEADAKKGEHREADRAHQLRLAEGAPLTALIDGSGKARTKALEASKKKEKVRVDLCNQAEDVEEAIDDARSRLKATDRELEKLVKVEKDAQEALDGNKRDLEETKQQLATSKVDVKTADANAKKRITAADAAHLEADAAVREHDGRARELDGERHRAQKEQDALQDAFQRKIAITRRSHSGAGKMADWVHDQRSDCPEATRAATVGPLYCHFDIPNKEHATLAERAISYAARFCFVARSDAAHSALLNKTHDQTFKTNVYKYGGSSFSPPRDRPTTAELKKFGVTAWLDEAITPDPEIERKFPGLIKGMLANLSGVHTILLCTAKADAPGVIDALEGVLKAKGINNVTVLTPSTTYRIQRSLYGDRKFVTTIQNVEGRRTDGVFITGVDNGRKQEVEAALKKAEAAVKAHDKALAPLRAALDAAAEEKEAARAEHKKSKDRLGRLNILEGRMKTLTQRRDAARAKVQNFDSEAKKAENRDRLGAAHAKYAAHLAKIVGAVADVVAARKDYHAAHVTHDAASKRLEELKEANREGQAEVDALKQAWEAAKQSLKTLIAATKRAEAEAKKSAKEFDPSARRSAEAQAAWDALPSDLVELDDEIETLTAEIDAEMPDEHAVKQYEERKKRIAEVRGRVEAGRGDQEAQAAELKKMEAKWRPQLEAMIRTVDSNFSAYFARFKCAGEVSLTDGRKLDDDGQPTGADDFSQYKVHIKVKWRASESLHVLGESGRDSGGERSVATMVYLISLQNINPAPFRVVDEINQAMDSTNERNVFECVTHACREGGKQYFLLTPKLLPDLDYSDDTTIHLVYNGAYNLPRQQLTLADYT